MRVGSSFFRPHVAMQWGRVLLCVAVSLGFVDTAPARAVVASLTCRVEPARPVLGQPVRWKIQGADLLRPLPEWHQSDFGEAWLLHGQSASRSVDSGGRAFQSAEITLFPMALGLLKLPRLKMGHLHCGSIQLDIASHAAGQSALQVISHIDPARPMVGQITRIELDLAGPGGLNWEDIPAQATDATLRELPASDGVVDAQDRGSSSRRYAWDVLPLRPGNWPIHLGPLRARRFGQLMIFPPLSLPLHVQPLPAFWPVDLPVGQPHFQALSAPRLLQVGEPGVLRGQLRAAGLSQRTLERIIAATAAPAGLKMYPPRIHQIGMAAQELEQIWAIDWPFRATHAGDLHYPVLRLPYENPVLGAPQVALADWGAAQSQDSGSWHLFLGLSAMLLLPIALFGARWAYKGFASRNARRQLDRMARNGDARALYVLWDRSRKARLQAVQASTLRGWLTQQQAETGCEFDQRYAKLVVKLERCLYDTTSELEIATEHRRDRTLSPRA